MSPPGAAPPPVDLNGRACILFWPGWQDGAEGIVVGEDMGEPRLGERLGAGKGPRSSPSSRTGREALSLIGREGARFSRSGGALDRGTARAAGPAGPRRAQVGRSLGDR